MSDESASAVDRSEGDVNLSAERTAWQDRSLDAVTRQLLAEDGRFFLHQALSTPCLNALRAVDGAYLEDLAGRRYLDFHGNSVHQVGFANPHVIEAIKQQLDRLSFCTRRYTNDVAVQLARRLTELAPDPLGKVLFTPSGTAAVGIALKLARMVTRRHKTVSMWGSFHGASLDAISIGGEAMFRTGVGPLLPGTSHVPPPGEYRCQWDCRSRGGCTLQCADYIDYVCAHEGDVAAVIAEPIRYGGANPHPDYWRRVRDICDRHNALLIFDEIPTGLGRTGKMFAFEHFGVVPDIVVLGKGLGGGILPMAAIIADGRFDVAQHAALGHYTHEKNPVLCAAALATLDFLEMNRLVDRAAELGHGALERLRAWQEAYPSVGDVRGIGLLLAIELVCDRQSRQPAVAEAERLMYRALDEGLSFKLTEGNIVVLAPPLTISEQQLDDALDIIERLLGEVFGAASAGSPPESRVPGA